MSHSGDRFENFKAELGSNRQSQEILSTRDDESYADLASLRDDINRLLTFLDVFIDELSGELDDFALPVGGFDTQLLEAHRQEWKKSGAKSSIPSSIGFRYYRYLQSRNTVASNKIRKKWEEAARDVLGSSALDTLNLVSIAHKEVSEIQSFLDSNIEEQSFDTAENRILEGLTDWTKSTFNKMQKLRSYIQSERPVSEIGVSFGQELTPDEARQTQSMFKTKMNAVNSDITKNTDLLNRNFSQYSNVFYKHFLEPSFKYRSKVSTKLSDLKNNSTKSELQRTSSYLDEDLRFVIADQERRKTFFNNKYDKILEDIKKRDIYSAMITGLGSKGKPLPTAGPRVMIQSEQTPEEIAHWLSVAPDDTGTNIISLHSRLDGLDDPDAHPQYLLKSGGTLTGDLELAEGVRVDGIIPSLHTHTGDDGTLRIRGDDIIEGTLRDDVVDEEAKPPTPINLQACNFEANVIPPGAAVVDTTLCWDSDDIYTHEVQLVKVPATVSAPPLNNPDIELESERAFP